MDKVRQLRGWSLETDLLLRQAVYYQIVRHGKNELEDGKVWFIQDLVGKEKLAQGFNESWRTADMEKTWTELRVRLDEAEFNKMVPGRGWTVQMLRDTDHRASATHMYWFKKI